MEVSEKQNLESNTAQSGSTKFIKALEKLFSKDLQNIFLH